MGPAGAASVEETADQYMIFQRDSSSDGEAAADVEAIEREVKDDPEPEPQDSYDDGSQQAGS